MVRAKMSDGEARQDAAWRYEFTSALAYREAQAILAETEYRPAPEDGGSAEYLPHSIFCDLTRAHEAVVFVDERTALAEALSAFVGA